MKKSSLTIAFAVIVFAVGSAFVTQAPEVDVSTIASSNTEEMAQIGYYKIPNQPWRQMQVACNPVTDTDLCLLPVPGEAGLHQIFDADQSTPLRRDP
ncbi:DUF6520 family protein [Maribacter sp. PR1]|uniref:DUF6520 family protein n=1 Tax=Maribacter cobaltidurans TaxID=1178778 RepID=A0ABU7IY20_9FLAO|nr:MULTISPECIES: DUF6520 family protein [Maribacter]MDC6390494.1 DUF6520 family protein [Maribacter sp. PR1]MEE1977884.1 DUF6520 family protein [Maribacter cobaltidurans]